MINEGRLDDFMALFERDATVVDGATYQGLEAARAWAERETFGVQMHKNVLESLEGGSHYARCYGVVACQLGKLLHHHRLRCCFADWIDVRGDHLDHKVSDTKVE